MFVLNTAVEMLLLLLQFLHDFDLILFADLHSWSTETTFARSYLAFAHFFPCRGQQSQQRERDWFLFENFSNLALMMECACSILKITTNIALLQDLELHSQRKLLLTRFCQLVSLISIVKWEISWPNLILQDHFLKKILSTNRWSKLTMFFRTSLVQHSFFQSQLGTNLLKGPGQKRWSREPIRTDSNCDAKDAT